MDGILTSGTSNESKGGQQDPLDDAAEPLDSHNGDSYRRKTDEEIFAGFEVLRNDQRHIANKLSTLEMDLNEHKVVISTLKLVDSGRKCFRMIGGILCEEVVSEVLVSLNDNKEQLTKAIDMLTKHLADKGQEVIKYKDLYKIKIRGEGELVKPQISTAGQEQSSGPTTSGNDPKAATAK